MKKLVIGLFSLIATFYASVWYATSGDTIATLSGQVTGYTLRSVTTDSNNNIVLAFDDMFGDYQIKVIERVSVPTESTGTTVNVYNTGSITGSGKTADQWIAEIENSGHAVQFPGFVLLLLAVWGIPAGAFVFGWRYGFRFFSPKKNG